jgi:hypothetical protein
MPFCFWMFVAGCATYTPLDSLFYESEYTRQSIDRDARNAMCLTLEGQGYQFDFAYPGDPFEVVSEYVVVTYPDNRQISYFTHYSITAKILTTINRDFDLGPFGITDTELARLLPEAQQTCVDVLSEASNYSLDNVETTIWMWDWLAGATVIWTTQIPGDCTSLEWSVASVGSGGDSYTYQTPISFCQ